MTVQPRSVAELQDAVRTHDHLKIRGGGTKSAAANGAGHVTLDMSGLSGILEYSPDECVFTALPGTTLRDIKTELAAHGQYLPFDPPLVDAGATIGGTVAAGVSGSGRYRYGGVRDFVIGARVVDGEGRLIHSGGKVVKNAAGFLLHHGMVGSLGTFGVLAEITFKVFPSPEARVTVRMQCASLPYACDTLHALERARFDLAAIDFDETGMLWTRVAGRADALAARVERLQHIVPWPSDVLDTAEDEQFWSDAREFRWADPESALVKVPISDPSVVGLGSFRRRSGQVSRAVRYACGGSVAWAAVEDPAAFSTPLANANLRGQIVRGENAGTIIGSIARNAFEERVRRVLDARSRFSRD